MPKPTPPTFEGPLDFAIETNSIYVVATVPEDELPSEGENRNYLGKLLVGVISDGGDTTVFESMDTPDVFSVEQIEQIVEEMRKATFGRKQK